MPFVSSIVLIRILRFLSVFPLFAFIANIFVCWLFFIVDDPNTKFHAPFHLFMTCWVSIYNICYRSYLQKKKHKIRFYHVNIMITFRSNPFEMSQNFKWHQMVSTNGCTSRHESFVCNVYQWKDDLFWYTRKKYAHWNLKELEEATEIPLTLKLSFNSWNWASIVEMLTVQCSLHFKMQIHNKCYSQTLGRHS